MFYSVWNSPCTWPSTLAPDRTGCTGASWAAGNPKTTQVHRGRKHRLNGAAESVVSFTQISVSLFSSVLFGSFLSFNNLTLTAGISYEFLTLTELSWLDVAKMNSLSGCQSSPWIFDRWAATYSAAVFGFCSETIRRKRRDDTTTYSLTGKISLLTQSLTLLSQIRTSPSWLDASRYWFFLFHFTWDAPAGNREWNTTVWFGPLTLTFLFINHPSV